MISIPEFLKEYLAEATLVAVTEGMSDARVWRIERAAKTEYYLKSVPGEDNEELRREAERLAWVSPRFPAPAVCAFGVEAGQSHLLTTAIRGIALTQLRAGQDAITIVKGVGATLQRLHRLAVTECPFDMQLTRRLALAEARVVAEEVDLENFDEEREGKDAELLWAEALSKRPLLEDLVVTHGDFTPANILIDPATFEVAGVIDWGRAGIADRYQDLALMVRELEPELQESFLEGYGMVQRLDLDKVAYYQLIDEFF